MKLNLIIFSLLLLFSVTANAQHSSDHKAKFLLSTGVYAGGVFTDIYSSRGLHEGNPLFRNSKGELSYPRAIGVAVVPYAITLWLDKKHHSRAANILRLTLGSFHYGLAIRNQSLRR